MLGRFFNQILTFILYLDNVSRIVLAEIGLAWPVGDRPMRDFRIAHFKSCEPRTVEWSKVYWIIVHVLDWFKNHHNLLINGFLTVKAGWGVYCFVEEEEGEGATLARDNRSGGPEPQARRLFKKNKVPFSNLAAEQNYSFSATAHVFT